MNNVKIVFPNTKHDYEDYKKLVTAGLAATGEAPQQGPEPYELIDNVFCPTGAGGGVDATCSPGGRSPLVVGLKTIKPLGGSTGAMLVETATGDKMVQKKVNTKLTADHLVNEKLAGDLYNIMGLKAPGGGLVKDKTGQVSSLLKSFHEGEQLNTWYAGKTPEQIKEMHAKISRGFVMDALMANWDVVGMGNDNILISLKGTPIRIDTGGALKYRAQGGSKPSFFNPEVNEIQTLRNGHTNPYSAKVFKDVTDADIVEQVQQIVGMKKGLVSFAKLSDPKVADALEARIGWLENKYLGKTPNQIKPSLPKEVFSGTTPGQILNNKAALLDHLTATAPKGTFSALSLKKLAWLNSEGLKDNTFYVDFLSDKNKTQATTEFLMKVLPAGTKVQVAHVGSSKLDEQPGGGVGTNKGKPWVVGGTTTTVPTKKPKTIQDVLDKPVNVVSGTDVHTFLGIQFPKFVGEVPVHEDHQSTYGEGKWPKEGDILDIASKSQIMFGDTTAAHNTWTKTISETTTAMIKKWKGSAQPIRAKIAEAGKTGTLDGPEKTFLRDLSKQPPLAGIFMRGIHSQHGEAVGNMLEAAFKSGDKVVTLDPAPHGVSENVGTAASFAAGRLLLRIKSRSARSIKNVSGFQSEAEAIQPPETKYRVLNVAKNVFVRGLKIQHFIDLEEI